MGAAGVIHICLQITGREIRQYGFRSLAEFVEHVADAQIRLEHSVDVRDQRSCRTFPLIRISPSRRSAVELLHVFTEPMHEPNLCFNFSLHTSQVNVEPSSVERQLRIVVNHASRL